MSNNNTSDKPVEQIELLCRMYRRGTVTSERAMALIVTIASKELLLSIEEQESSVETEKEWNEVDHILNDRYPLYHR